MTAKATSGGFEPKAIRPPDGALWSAATSPPPSRRTDPSPSPGSGPPPSRKVPRLRPRRSPASPIRGARKPARVGSAGIPLAPLLGLLFLVVAGAAGYVYWDYSAHFESTDDAFIAARQFAIAPQVAGYVTAVPVTDNQHVEQGGVIARDRPARLPRRARAGRGASGGRRKPASTTSTRRSPRKRRRSPRARRRWPRRRRIWSSRRSPGDATSRSSIRVGRRLSRARSTSRLSRPSRPLSTARKRRSRWRSGKSTR